MRLPERILILLSRDVNERDFCSGSELSSAGSGSDQRAALGVLIRAFPNLEELVRGKRVLDFGCGEGRQAIALAKLGALEVVGLDTNLATLGRAKLNIAAAADSNVRLIGSISDASGYCDVVISQNAMEHFPDPARTLAEMVALTKPGGVVLITFGPPWYAPWGSHMHFFTKVPWINLIFSESTVMAVRSRYRSDGARRYEEVESGLNKMSIAKFHRLIRAVGLKPSYWNMECIKGLNFLSSVPVLRELFVNRVSVALRRQ